VSAQALQVVKKPRKPPKYPSWKKGPRLWVEVTKDEARRARTVAQHLGLQRGFMLRKYSLNDLLKIYDEQFGDGGSR
jgi:hypothetical protein